MKSFLLLLYVGLFVTSCKQPDSAHRPKQGDSAEIVKLLKDVYRWHDKTQDSLTDFSIIVKDSFQVGVDYDSLNRTINALKKTDYFSSTFIDNYKKMADLVNNKLTRANPKLLNEINFSFQDADPWTGFQDSAPNYWDKFTIKDYTARTDSAFLKWEIHSSDWSSEPYSVGFSFENGKWRVAYLEGFDLKQY
jgi:hypothetical protein